MEPNAPDFVCADCRHARWLDGGEKPGHLPASQEPTVWKTTVLPVGGKEKLGRPSERPGSGGRHPRASVATTGPSEGLRHVRPAVPARRQDRPTPERRCVGALRRLSASLAPRPGDAMSGWCRARIAVLPSPPTDVTVSPSCRRRAGLMLAGRQVQRVDRGGTTARFSAARYGVAPDRSATPEQRSGHRGHVVSAGRRSGRGRMNVPVLRRGRSGAAPSASGTSTNFPHQNPDRWWRVWVAGARARRLVKALNSSAALPGGPIVGRRR